MAISFLADIDNYDEYDANVLKSGRYLNIRQRFDAIFGYHNSGGVDDADLIIDCHALAVEIDKEIVTTHNSVRDMYPYESSELESLVHHPIEYARFVKNIGKDPIGDLEGLGLPSEFIMVFSCWRVRKAMEACDRALALHSAKKKVLDFAESRIGFVAPNLCSIVGTALAVKLMAGAGGLSSLAKMRNCDVLRLGAKREGNLSQFFYGGGYIEQSEIIQSTPPSLRMRASALVALKCTLTALIDSTRQYPTGQHGTSYREEIWRKLEKWQKIVKLNVSRTSCEQCFRGYNHTDFLQD